MKLYIGILILALSLSADARHRLLVSDCAYGEVAVYASDGSKEWSYPEEREISDARLLADGTIAMAYKYGARIIQPDWNKDSIYTVILDRPTPEGGETHTCMPLPNGGFLIGESYDDVSFIIELDYQFNETYRVKLEGLGGKHSTFRQIRKTTTDTYLITQQKKNGGIGMEVNRSGKIIRQFPDGKYVAERLDNGNTHLACGDNHCIKEIAPDNTVVWQLEQNDLPGITIGFVAGLQRLSNGNTLFSNWGGHGDTTGDSLIEVTPDKQVVWSSSPGRTNRISNVKVLD